MNRWARLTEEERKGYVFDGTVTDVPQGFKVWVEDNQDRIAKAKTLPYFLKENEGYISAVNGTAAKTETEKLAEAIGMEVGEPMRHEQADCMHPNPHYSEDVQYRINCQSAVVAYELRRRGLELEAFGRTDLSMAACLAKKTQAAWIDAEGNMPVPIVCRQTVKTRTIDRRGSVRTTYTSVEDVWKEFLGKTGDTGRYHLSWTWEKKNTGHIITMETLKDGTRRFYDPQTGHEATSIMPWIMRNGKIDFDMKRGIKVYRVDTLQPNNLVATGVVKRAGGTLATPKMTREQKLWWDKNVGKLSSNSHSGNTTTHLNTKDYEYISPNKGSVTVHPMRLMKANMNKQGGEAVVLEIPNASREYFTVLSEAKRKVKGRIFFYVKGENIVKEIK